MNESVAGNLSQPFGITPEEYQNLVRQSLSDAFNSLPSPAVPSWLESAAEFIKAHPWLSLGVALLVLLIISAIIRELICSYLKTNEILARVKKLEEKSK